MSPFRLSCVVVLLVAATVAMPGEPLSPRNANYEIDVRLDTEARMLEGRAVIEWRNIQSSPTDELWFHLYWNAWRNNLSTWMLEDRVSRRNSHRRSPRGRPAKEDWSWLELDSLELLSPDGRQPLDWHFSSPDDGNPDDRTVLVASLPQAVAPGSTVEVELSWRARIPRTFARTGYRGDYYFIAQWFPKLGVFEPDGWNCHQFHASTEFYSDYGVYDVRMTVPEHFVFGATGREQDRARNGDGTMTHRYRQEDVHDFVWTASPNFRVLEERFESAGLPAVELRLLIQPEHLSQAARHFAATRAAIESYGRWYGPYPYGHVTVVDPAYESGTGGMEYPTLFTSGTRRFNPEGGDSPELVTIHEMGHQFWYGIVGNNEFEHAWLDEGLNTFSTIRTLETTYPKRVLIRRYLGDALPLRFPEIEVPRWSRRLQRYGGLVAGDAPSKPSYTYYPGGAAAISYDKTALWLVTLERHLGWETLRAILSTFFERYKFAHPTAEDFLAVADEVAGQDLSWFFDQVYRDSVTFDYGIGRIHSARLKPKGWGDSQADGRPARLDDSSSDEPAEPDDGEDGESADRDDDSDDDERPYRTEVVVQRIGEGRFPVEVLMVFKDGHEIRESWDGQDRWKMYVVEHPAKLTYAEVDPDRVLMLDTERWNNSQLRKPKGKLPAGKWASKWMIWFQDRLASFAYFM